MPRSTFALLAALLLAAAGLAGSASAQSASPVAIKVGYDGFSMTTGPMNYGVQKGIFKKHGLDVTLVGVAGGSALTQAVVGGSVELAQNGYTPALAAAVAGGDIVIIGGISNKLPFQLVVKADIKSGADLKGKKLAISRFGSSTDTAATFALQHLGLKRSDVTILQVGNEGTRMAAMASGQVDGTFDQYPNTAELEAQGHRMLVDVTPIAGDYPNTSYVTSRAYLKKNPEVAKRFLMSVTESIRAYKNDPEGAMRLTAQFLNIKEGPILKRAYEFYTKEVFPDLPEYSLKGMQLVLDELKQTVPAAGKAKPEQFVDGSVIEQLKKEGYPAKVN